MIKNIISIFILLSMTFGFYTYVTRTFATNERVQITDRKIDSLKLEFQYETQSNILYKMQERLYQLEDRYEAKPSKKLKDLIRKQKDEIEIQKAKVNSIMRKMDQ